MNTSESQEGSSVRSDSAELGDALRILNLITESNDRISNRIKETQSLSEREILACGSVLSSIVDEAKHLAEETNQAVAASMARSEEITLRFVKGMREDILAQENAVQNVLDLASRIEEAIVAINDLTMSSKVLAINARIEAARLGAQGRGFAVIAGSLGELSSVIRAASDKVGSAINAVREGLPSVRARAASMNQRTTVFADEVAEQVKSASMQTDGNRSHHRLAALRELSNQGLSHLQFQDPAAQKLESIIAELEASKERVRLSLSGQFVETTREPDPVIDDGQPNSGEIMLF